MSVVRRHWSGFADLWCAVMHDRVSWPINGRYRCAVCSSRLRKNTLNGPKHVTAEMFRTSIGYARS